MERRDKRTLKKRQAARAAKRRTLAEVERLAAKGDAHAKQELRDFVRSCEQLSRTATAEFQRLQAELDASIKHAKATMSPAEIMQKLRKTRPIGAPPKAQTAEWIEKIAVRERDGKPSLRELARLFRPGMTLDDGYAALRRFKSEHKQAIDKRVRELRSDYVTR